MKKEDARAALIAVLRNAYSGELAASLAYGGHAASVSDPQEREEILVILRQELEHRELVGKMLAELGASPSPVKEKVFFLIGTAISLLCRAGGWFIPMYGAGKLESGNIVEYEVAARHARDAGYPQYVDCILRMAEVEWDHELYFRRKVESSIAHKLFPRWPVPPPREDIRRSFEAAGP